LVVKVGLIIGAAAFELPTRVYFVVGKPYLLASAACLPSLVISEVGRLALQCSSCHFKLILRFYLGNWLDRLIDVVTRISAYRFELPFWHYLVFRKSCLLWSASYALVSITLCVT